MTTSSGYVPIATFTVSPLAACVTARATLLHGVATTEQSFAASLPSGVTKRSVALARPPKVESTRTRRTASRVRPCGVRMGRKVPPNLAGGQEELCYAPKSFRRKPDPKKSMVRRKSFAFVAETGHQLISDFIPNRSMTTAGHRNH